MFYKFRYVFLIIKIFPIFLFSACFTPTVDHNQARMLNYFDEKRTFFCGDEHSAVITTEFFSSDNCLVELKLDEFDSPITTMVPIKFVYPYSFDFNWKGKVISCNSTHFVGRSHLSKGGRTIRMSISIGESSFQDETMLIDYLNAYRESGRKGRYGCLTKDGVFCLIYVNSEDIAIEIHRLMLDGKPVNSSILKQYIGLI